MASGGQSRTGHHLMMPPATVGAGREGEERHKGRRELDRIKFHINIHKIYGKKTKRVGSKING